MTNTLELFWENECTVHKTGHYKWAASWWVTVALLVRLSCCQWCSRWRQAAFRAGTNDTSDITSPNLIIPFSSGRNDAKKYMRVLWPQVYDGVSKGKPARAFSSWRPRARAQSPQPHRSASPECQTTQQPPQCQESPSCSLSGPRSAVWWHHCANDPDWELLHGAPWLGKVEVVDIQ